MAKYSQQEVHYFTAIPDVKQDGDQMLIKPNRSNQIMIQIH